jgi:hypothetical protein
MTKLISLDIDTEAVEVRARVIELKPKRRVGKWSVPESLATLEYSAVGEDDLAVALLAAALLAPVVVQRTVPGVRIVEYKLDRR